MSYGAGHVFDMINRLKQNRAQRPSNRPKFKENNREGIYSTDKTSHRPNFRIVPENELKEIKKQIRERAKAVNKKEQILYVAFAICAIITLVVILILIT